MPSREPTADVLTEQEVGHFHAFGYVVLRAALSPQEVVELQAAYDRVVAGEAAEVRDTGTVNVDRPHEAGQAFLDLIGHPRLMAAMRQIDGTEFLFHSAQATHRQEEVRWHCGFFPPHVTCKPMKVNVYLDSTHMDDGARSCCSITATPAPTSSRGKRSRRSGSPRPAGLWRRRPRSTPSNCSLGVRATGLDLVRAVPARLKPE